MNKNTVYALVGIAVVLLIGIALARSTPSTTEGTPATNSVMVVSSTTPMPVTTTTAMEATSTTMTPPAAAATTTTPPVMTPPPKTPPVVTPPVSADSYTLVQVASHNTGSSCWTTIQGNVYDVTSWINRHPGGSDAILSLCGKDGSTAFEDQHGGERRPEKELASFKIGTLTK